MSGTDAQRDNLIYVCKLPVWAHSLTVHKHQGTPGKHPQTSLLQQSDPKTPHSNKVLMSKQISLIRLAQACPLMHLSVRLVTHIPDDAHLYVQQQAFHLHNKGSSTSGWNAKCTSRRNVYSVSASTRNTCLQSTSLNIDQGTQKVRGEARWCELRMNSVST